MLYKKATLPKLTQELFTNPTSEYRGTPFWSWNCEITKDLIKDQIEIFKGMGMGGVHIHPRTGLKTPYLGDEYMEYIQYSNEVLKENNMYCWLYDEDRYPSGAAGGMVTENLNYRARHLLLTRKEQAHMCKNREEFLKLIAKGEKPGGYYLTSYTINLKDGYLDSYNRTNQKDMQRAQETSKDEKVWHAYLELAEESPWYNDQTYINALDKEAVEEFIRITHEKYFQAVGDDFGKSIPAIFTDEPHVKGKMTHPFADSEKDITMSFTDDMPDTFKKAYGIDLLDVLPEILWQLPDEKVSVHRYHYHDHMTERFVSAFTDTIGQWCEDHDIALTGHFLSERSLYSQTLALGETMRNYRSFQIPGVDILCDQKELSTLKQAVSVARQYGREGVISELYGVTHWDHDFKGHKL
ncbi:MAG TPA: hypothetical protein GX707_11510, partial [Epulopiscium sp.]|nr:hypothetical protein [Candidatus Epulonipiscium sp.]